MPFRLPMCLALLAAINAGAATFHVDIVIDSVDILPGDGLCADADGHCSLRAAVQETNARNGGDIVLLDAGTYLLMLPGTGEDAGLAGDLDIADALELHGAGAEATIIDGGALDRVLDLRGSTPNAVRLQELTVRNGFLGTGAGTDGSTGIGGIGGAGIRVGAGTTLAMSHVDIRDNHSANMFGAVAIDNAGCIEGDHVRIVGNTDLADVGSGDALSGGIETDGVDTCLVLDDSEISGNRGDFSGALHVDGGASVTLRRTLIADNVARFSGGLELNVGGEVLLENVTISGNAGSPGAALVDGGTHFILVNSTVTGNHGSNGTPVTGGILDVHGGFGLTFLRNTILAGNGDSIYDNCRNGNSLGGNIIGSTAGCMFDAQPTDLLDVDPGLGALVDNGGFTRTHLPGPNAIDHGIADGCTDWDQRGVARPQDGDADGIAACDIGAVEVAGGDTIFVDGFETPAG
jgi:hypothetical protein